MENKKAMPGEDWYQVNEIFHAPQGEGYFTGVMSTFIRLQGCIVGCEWCDTKYTWYKGGERMATEDIAKAVRYKHVVITGGEPTQWKLYDLVRCIKQDNPGVTVQLETSGLGIHPLPPSPGQFTAYQFDWVTCSPKENLHFQVALNVIPNEFKFVVDDNFDITTAMRIRKHYALFTDVNNIYWYLQAEGEPPRQEMIDKTLRYIETHPEFRFGGRLHTWIKTR